MSDTVCSGIISKLESGRFDNQYEVEIKMADGSIYKGADGVSVYSVKKDGTEAKVWPLVKESFTDGVPFVWTGNFRETDTKGGPKTYCTITWGQIDTEFQPPGGNGWGEPAKQEAPPADDWGTPAPAAAPVRSQQTDKDALITATAITKSLIEGRYLNLANLDSGEFKQVVQRVVALVHEVAGS